MTNTTETDEALTKAAQVRALLNSYISQLTAPESTDKIFQTLKEQFQVIKVTNKVVSYYLRELTDNGAILCTREGTRNMYFGKTNKSLKPTKVDVKIKSLKTNVIPSYKIDVVKGQKRVRITLDNVMFDIGLVED